MVQIIWKSGSGSSRMKVKNVLINEHPVTGSLTLHSDGDIYTATDYIL